MVAQCSNTPSIRIQWGMKNRRGQATGWGQYVASVSAMTLLSGSDVTCHLAEVTFPPLSQSKLVINLVAKPVPLITKGPLPEQVEEKVEESGYPMFTRKTVVKKQ